MGIMDELSAIDKKLQDDLEKRRINAEKVESDEFERKKNERRRQKKLKTEKILEILEDSDEGLDEPCIYKIYYSHSGGGGYGYGELIEKGTASCEVLMTEREKRIAQLTGHIKECTDAGRLAYGCKCTRIESIMTSSRELSDVEKMEIASIKQKISIIKTNEEAKSDCVLDLEDDEFDNISIHTSLRNALLSSVSINNGEITLGTPEQQTEQTRSELPVKAESKISFRTLRETIKKVLGKGER